MKKILTLIVFLVSMSLYSQEAQYAGEKDGYMEYTLVSDNGRLLERGTYWEGKKDGYWYSYHPNGKISATAQFSNNKRVGTWKFYSEEGNLVGEVRYKDNKRVSAAVYKDFNNS